MCLGFSSAKPLQDPPIDAAGKLTFREDALEYKRVECVQIERMVRGTCTGTFVHGKCARWVEEDRVKGGD